MGLGYELSHGAKRDRATYLTPPPPGSTLGYETSVIGTQVYTGQVVLMSLHVDIGAIVDNFWIQVYDWDLVVQGALDPTNAAFVRRSRAIAANDRDLTWDWCPCDADEVEDQNPVNRGDLNTRCDSCENICAVLPIKGFPFDRGIVVTASLNKDKFLAPPAGVIRICARMRYGAEHLPDASKTKAKVP